MQIEISNETAAQLAAAAAGFPNVEDFVNNLIKRESDLLAIKKGLADAEAGNIRPFEDFDKEFRSKNGFARKSET